MNISVAEQRRETRREGRGNVLVHPETPGSRDIQGRLVDVSTSGFRMAHHCSALTAGQYVTFAHVEARGRARASMDAYPRRFRRERLCGRRLIARLLHFWSSDVADDQILLDSLTISS